MSINSTFPLRQLLESSKLKLLETLDISDNPMISENELVLLFRTLSGVSITNNNTNNNNSQEQQNSNSNSNNSTSTNNKCPALKNLIMQNVGLTNVGCNSLRHMIINNNVSNRNGYKVFINIHVYIYFMLYIYTLTFHI